MDPTQPQSACDEQGCPVDGSRLPGGPARPRWSRLGHVTRCCIAPLLALFGAGGCHQYVTIHSKGAFEKTVLKNPRPVLVEFSKDGCAPCIAMNPILDQLARDYKGRASVVKYRHMSFTFIHTSFSITRKYGVYFVPTVILFVDGKEEKRWFSDFRLSTYRKALDKALSAREHASVSAVP
ncbi:MAG: hypothetical protein BIFFINMI_04344 [Phycisphaerae bacterium]|nr:hypothetical protein [Phycisphaerae bacterium]